MEDRVTCAIEPELAFSRRRRFDVAARARREPPLVCFSRLARAVASLAERERREGAAGDRTKVAASDVRGARGRSVEQSRSNCQASGRNPIRQA